MSKFTRFQKILLGLIAVLLVFSLLTYGKSSILKSVVYDPLIMLKYSVIDYPIETVRSWVQDFNDLWYVHEENDHLRYELSQQEQYAALVDELRRENEELSSLLELRQTNYESISARVVNRNAETWNNLITLNVGANDGILVDMAVVNHQGLVGKVVEVGEWTCRVRLLTSQDQLSKVAVRIVLNEESTIEGYLEEYDLERKSFRVRLFTDSEEIQNGQKVITSGLGGVFPNGILVGEVNEVVEMINETGMTVYVTPAADFNDFDYVSVINEVIS